jgi:hypothetical protein
VSRGAGTLGLDPRKCSEPQVVIIVDDISLYPREFYDSGLEVITASTIRNHHNALNPRIKSLNYLNNGARRVSRGYHAQRPGRGRGVYRRQHLHRLGRSGADAADQRRHP